MNETLAQAVEAINAKIEGGFDGVAKFEITGIGAVVVDSDGARIGDDDADVTLTAEPDTFKGILEGDVNPTMAFMSGKLKIDGSMSMAMKLASALG